MIYFQSLSWQAEVLKYDALIYISLWCKDFCVLFPYPKGMKIFYIMFKKNLKFGFHI